MNYKLFKKNLMEVYQQLTIRQQTIISMRYKDNMSFEEIGRVLGLHPKIVERNHDRAVALVNIGDEMSDKKH